MSEEVKNLLSDLRALGQRYRDQEVNPRAVRGGPVGLHSEGFNERFGTGHYGVGTVILGIADHLERKYQ